MKFVHEDDGSKCEHKEKYEMRAMFAPAYILCSGQRRVKVVV